MTGPRFQLSPLEDRGEELCGHLLLGGRRRGLAGRQAVIPKLGVVRSAELFDQPDDDALGAADVAVPVDVPVLRHLAHELGAVGAPAGYSWRHAKTRSPAVGHRRQHRRGGGWRAQFRVGGALFRNHQPCVQGKRDGVHRLGRHDDSRREYLRPGQGPPRSKTAWHFCATRSRNRRKVRTFDSSWIVEDPAEGFTAHSRTGELQAFPGHRYAIASRAFRHARPFGRGAGVAVRARRPPSPSRAWPTGRPAGRWEHGRHARRARTPDPGRSVRVPDQLR